MSTKIFSKRNIEDFLITTIASGEGISWNGSAFIPNSFVTVSGGHMTGILDMRDNAIININYIDFDLDNGIEQAEGRMVWNDDEGTINLGLKGGFVNLQLGFEQLIRGKNVTGTGTTDGRPARVSDVSGNRPEFSFSEADVPASAGSIGLFTEDIGNNANGYVTTFGLVRDLDTSGTPVSETWNDNDRLYVSNIEGQLTNVMPSGTERIIFIGKVINANPSEGIIFVSPINVSYLPELSGVTITSVVDNDVLTYESSTGLWVNKQSSIKNTTRVTTTYTILVTDEIIFANTDSAGYIISLPVGIDGQTFKIINSGTSGKTLTVSPNGAEKLLGANTNFNLSDQESLLLTFEPVEGWA